MSTGLGSSRRRERVLLGLDQAFASSSSLTASSSSGNAAAALGRAGSVGGGAGAGQAGSKTASNDATLYTELPAQILTTTAGAESDKVRLSLWGGVSHRIHQLIHPLHPLSLPQPAPPTTVEGALQDLLLRNTRDLQLKGKTVTLDNTRGQNDQQRKEARLRRQLLRGRTRFSVSIAEEGGGGGGGGGGAAAAGEKEEADADGSKTSKKRKRKRQVAAYQDYVALEGAWQGYMQELLGVRTEVEEVEKEEKVREGEDSNGETAAKSRSISIAKSAFSSKKSAERNVAGADLHGARLRMIASKCSSEVGLEGVVLRESRGALHILPVSDKQRRVKIVPKAGRRFQATVEGGGGKAGGGGREGKKLTLILHGNGLVYRGRAMAPSLMMRRDKGGGGGEAGRLLRTTHLV